MRIDWLTVIAQIVNFLVLVWLLKRFLYQPVIDTMARREERIAARLNEARQRETEAETQRRSYQDRTEALERAWNEKIDEARAAAMKERHGLLDEARQEIDLQRERWREELQREQDDFRKALRRGLAESATRIARRALADLAGAGLEREIVTAFLARWQQLPPDDRKPFLQASEPLRITSSFDLDDATRQRLQDALSPPSGIRFARDPGSVCGITLTSAGRKLGWNVDEYLDDIENGIHAHLEASEQGERT